MKIIIAKGAGFCFGVKRASELVQKKSESTKKINTYGPLIHNNQYISFLEKKNIFSVDKIKDIDAEKVVIRSHGVTKSEESKLRSKKLDIIDATCPFVKRVHKLAESLEKKGYQILIFGEKKHPEVIGIRSYAKNSMVVGDINDVSNLNRNQKIAFISQTTQNIKLFESSAKYLKNRFKNVKTVHTICDATKERQEGAKELAKKVDLMIIIGGKHSSNTTRLKEVCQELAKSYHIEEDKELKKKWFRNIEKVGITAGASTPDFILSKVIDRIKSYA